MLTPMKAAIAAIVLMMATAPPAAANMTSVPAGKARIIDAHGACRVVENKNTRAIMIPHRNRSEWSFGANAFLAKARQGVNVKSCDERVVDVDSNTHHYYPFTGTCAVDVQGDVFCWGVDQTATGAIGQGMNMHPVANRPKRIAGLPPMATVGTTGETSCGAASGSGDVWCWGLGLKPFKRTGVTGIVDIEGAFFSHIRANGTSTLVDLFCGKKSDNTMWCWMVNGNTSTYGRAPFQVAKPIAGAIGTFEVGNGTLYWRVGRNTYMSYLPANLGNALRTVRLPQDPRDLVDIKLLNWGLSFRNNRGLPDSHPGMNGCAKKSDGTLWCWGQELETGDRGGQAFDSIWPGLGVKAIDANWFTVSKVTPRAGSVQHLIHTGGSGMCVVYNDDRSWCNRPKHNIQRSWSDWNVSGPMASRAETVPAFVEMFGDFHGEADVVWGTAVRAAYRRGQGWACGLDANGGLWCKGLNGAGQLGLGHTNDRANWQRVSF